MILNFEISHVVYLLFCVVACFGKYYSVLRVCMHKYFFITKFRISLDDVMLKYRCKTKEGYYGDDKA